MITNPFTQEYNDLLIEQKDANIELQRQKVALAWFRAFDFDRANTELRSAERAQADAQGGLPIQLQAEAQQKERVNQLEQKASLGFDPRYWFSAERVIAKRELAQAKEKLEQQQGAIAELRTQVSTSVERHNKAREEIEKARRFEPLNAEGAIAVLLETLNQLGPRLNSLRQRRDDLDKVIREPLAQLQKYESQRNSLQATILKAERFDTALSNASGSPERARIHREAERALGTSRPGQVLRESRGALRSVDDSIGKLRARIDSLIRFATQDIRRIVIDGNNLCYGGSQFLGFRVLEAVVPLLAEKYEVTLIFDASIRRRMEMRSQDVEAHFPQAKLVHVVANKRKADETILAVADEDEHTFVVSNDKFADFPEKMAVKERRVLRHEIVDKVAYIHDLHITAKFANLTTDQAGTPQGN